MLISIVIPVYQAENITDELVLRIKNAMQFAENNYEIILVDDGSTDNSWITIEKNAALNPEVIGVKLSRNFGQHHAITAGLDYCKGDWIVVMDCDLQDRPEEIERLYNKALTGYELVFAKRINRKGSLIKKIQANIFYNVFTFLTGIKYDGSIGNFGIYSRKVIDNIKTMREPMRAFSPMVRWLGFSKGYVDVQHASRVNGTSTYSYKKIITLAFDTILSYSDRPLKLMIRLGFFISIISMAIASYYLIKYLAGKILVSGYTSIILSIWFLGGLIILNLGVLGLYISKIFTGIKNRPLYIIDRVFKKEK
jgi:dolichol-phosphate mannosyltransferase